MELIIRGPVGESRHPVSEWATVGNIRRAAIASQKVMGLDDRDAFELAYNGQVLTWENATVNYLGFADGDILDLLATGSNV